MIPIIRKLFLWSFLVATVCLSTFKNLQFVHNLNGVFCKYTQVTCFVEDGGSELTAWAGKKPAISSTVTLTAEMCEMWCMCTICVTIIKHTMYVLSSYWKRSSYLLSCCMSEYCQIRCWTCPGACTLALPATAAATVRKQKMYLPCLLLYFSPFLPLKTHAACCTAACQCKVWRSRVPYHQCPFRKRRYESC